MKQLTNLFKLLQVTRSQPLYGSNVSGITKNELGDLAQHHYLVTFIGWQFASHVKDLGANINVQRVLELCLIHDLGELFGSDISFFYARVNAEARKHAKAFEKENQYFLSQFFGKQKQSFLELSEEVTEKKTDESLIAKMADFVECTHFKVYVDHLTQYEQVAIKEISDYAQKIKDPIANKELTRFVDSWSENVGKGNVVDIIWNLKK